MTFINRVAFYVRVSTDDKGQDYNQQIEALNKEIDYRNSLGEKWEVVQIYRDEESAFQIDRYDKRTGLGQMFADAKQRKFNTLFVYSQDRFSRLDPIDATHDMLRLVKDLGVRYISLIDRIDSKDEQFIPMLGWMSLMAKRDSENKSKATKRGIASKYKTKDGKWKKPFGPIIKSYKLRTNRVNGETIPEKIIRLSGQGKSIREIRKEVYYWTKSGNQKPISVGYVSKILKEKRMGVHWKYQYLIDQDSSVFNEFTKEPSDEQGFNSNNNKKTFGEQVV